MRNTGLVLVACAFLLVSCVRSTEGHDQSLSDTQVHFFLGKYQVAPMKVEHINETTTVIAWAGYGGIGCDILSSYPPHNNDTLFTTGNARSVWVTEKASTDKVFLAHSSIIIPSTDAVCLVVNDAKISNQMKHVRVIFDDGFVQEKEVGAHQNVLVLWRKPTRLTTATPRVIIYDGRRNILLEL